MTANDFFERQLITDANSVIDKNAHKFSRNDLIKFAEAYHRHKVKKLNIPDVSMQSELLFAFIKAIKEEFVDQNWDYLDFIADRVIGKQ